MIVKGHMLAAFKEGSQSKHITFILYISLTRTRPHGSIQLQRMLGNVVFILFWEDFISAKIGDSTTMKTRGAGYQEINGGFSYSWLQREEKVRREAQLLFLFLPLSSIASKPPRLVVSTFQNSLQSTLSPGSTEIPQFRLHHHPLGPLQRPLTASFPNLWFLLFADELSMAEIQWSPPLHTI